MDGGAGGADGPLMGITIVRYAIDNRSTAIAAMLDSASLHAHSVLETEAARAPEGALAG